MSDTNWQLWARSIAEPQAIGYQIAANVPTSTIVGGSIAAAFLNYIMPMIAHPVERELMYRIQAHSPGVVPPPESIVASYYAGVINSNDASLGLAYHGIDWRPWEEANSHNKKLWASHILLAKPQYPLEMYRKWFRQNRISRNELIQKMARVTMADAGQNDLFIADYQSLSPGDIQRLYFHGRIERDEAIRRLVELGIRNWDAEQIIDTGMATPDVPTLLAAYNRHLITQTDLDTILLRIGFSEVRTRRMLMEFAKVLPSPAELTYLVVKDVWNQAVVDRFGYDLERPIEYDYWANRIGMGHSMSINEQERERGEGPSLAVLNWRAKWHIVSPEQGFNLLHRCRGNPDDPATWRIPGVRPFTTEDLNYVLQIDDYAPGIRDQLRAVSFMPLRLVDIRNSIRYLGSNRDWAIEQFMDRGSSRENAEHQADLAIAQFGNPAAREADARRKATLRKFIQNILNQYRDGVLSRQDTVNFLLLRGFTQEDADLEITNIDIELNALSIADFLRGTRGDYLSGRRSLQQVQGSLVLAGISSTRVNYYIQRWQFQRNARVVQLSTAKVIRVYRSHFISRDEALARLTNLGWNLPDSLLQLAEAERLITEDMAALSQSQERQGEARAREIEANIRRQEQARTRMQQALRVATPVTTLMRWFKNGLWTEARVRSRLAAMGYPQDAINTYIEENRPHGNPQANGSTQSQAEGN